MHEIHHENMSILHNYRMESMSQSSRRKEDQPYFSSNINGAIISRRAIVSHEPNIPKVSQEHTKI